MSTVAIVSVSNETIEKRFERRDAVFCSLLALFYIDALFHERLIAYPTVAL